MLNSLLKGAFTKNARWYLPRSLRGFHSTNKLKKEVQVFVDDHPLKVDSSYTIFQAAHEAGVVIPRFCYHERLSVAGNCRMCLVEIEIKDPRGNYVRSPKPVAACAAQVSPDMKVHTKSEKTRIARGGVMEFLLANHPLDCPICDQGGECDLQDISQVYGYGTGRFNEYKRAVEDKNFGPIIATSMNRCIHCTRCIRFAEEVAGTTDLGTAGRGRSTEISTYVEKMLTSELSGNLADVCPVGALNHGPSRYQNRSWELKTVESIDAMDSLGSVIDLNFRGAELMRVLPRVHEEINEEWISDKSRYSYDGLKKQRLTYCMQRKPDGTYAELKWPEALAVVGQKLNATKSGSEIAAIIGEFSDVESVVALKDLLNRYDCDTFEIRSDAPKLNADLRASYLMNSRIQGVEESDLLLLVGVNPKYESPVFNARILKATRRNDLKVAVIGTPADLTYDYLHLGNSTKTLVEIAEGRHPFCGRLANAKLPMIIVGARALEREDGAGILSALNTIAANSNVVSARNKWNGLNILHKEISRAGALDIGISSTKVNKSGAKPKVVFILGCDSIKTEDIPEDAFVVYVGTHGDEGAYFADIILPAAAYTEKSTTYVNTEGRPQVTRLAVTPPGQGKVDWEIIRALSEECGQTLPYDTIEEIRYRIAELAPHLLKYDYIEPTAFSELAVKAGSRPAQINLTPLEDTIDNFYQTDAISRSSVTMAKCSTAYNHLKFSNFKQNVFN